MKPSELAPMVTTALYLGQWKQIDAGARLRVLLDFNSLAIIAPFSCSADLGKWEEKRPDVLITFQELVA